MMTQRWRHQNACATVEFLERETPEFVSPLLCPPNSPDLNPVDYSVWSILQEKVYKTRITDLDDLKHRITIRNELANLRHVVIAAAVCHWRCHLSTYVRADSGHFEHCFYINTAALVTIAQCNALVARCSRQLIGPADWVCVTLGPLRCD